MADFGSESPADFVGIRIGSRCRLSNQIRRLFEAERTRPTPRLTDALGALIIPGAWSANDGSQAEAVLARSAEHDCFVPTAKIPAALPNYRLPNRADLFAIACSCHPNNPTSLQGGMEAHPTRT